MIAKEADPVRNKARRAQAGAHAEQDMAFYLRRAFGNHRPDILVFNDIRLQHDGEIAQIDHLVVHLHGMFVIESKSVSGEIHIMRDGQFIRHFGQRKKAGMVSPVLQAQRQADLLRRLLQANKVSLRERKLLGMLQGGFANCPIEVRVAISDRGIIRGDQFAPEVRKADIITQDIEGRIAAHRFGASLLNLDAKNEDGMYRFTSVEMERLQRFLLDQHFPRSKAEEAAAQAAESEAPRPVPPPVQPSRRPSGQATKTTSPPGATTRGLSTAAPVQFLCSKCQSLNLRIEHGRYGYYLKCQECGGNTWIDTRIDGTERKGCIRKSGREFYLVCPDTGNERLLYTNPIDPAP